MMYGIPVEQWETLNDAQRLEEIKGHNEREPLRQQERLRAQEARAVAAKKAVHVAEPQTVVVVKTQPDVQPIYRGEAGCCGD